MSTFLSRLLFVSTCVHVPTFAVTTSAPTTSPVTTCANEPLTQCPGTSYTCSCATCYDCRSFAEGGVACNCFNCGCYSKCPGTGNCTALPTPSPTPQTWSPTTSAPTTSPITSAPTSSPTSGPTSAPTSAPTSSPSVTTAVHTVIVTINAEYDKLLDNNFKIQLEKTIFLPVQIAAEEEGVTLEQSDVSFGYTKGSIVVTVFFIDDGNKATGAVNSVEADAISRILASTMSNVTVDGVTYPVLGAQSSVATPPVVSDDNDDDAKRRRNLAIGLGIGIGLLVLLIVVICVVKQCENDNNAVAPSTEPTGQGSWTVTPKKTTRHNESPSVKLNHKTQGSKVSLV